MKAKVCGLQNLLMVSASLIASVAVAAAQTPPPPATPAPGWRHDDAGRSRRDWQANRAEMEERRLAKLHTKLDLKPGQEGSWQAFVTGLQAARAAPEPQDEPDRSRRVMETTPERLDHMLERVDDMRAHLAQMDRVVKTFYAGLSKDQQTIFDDNFKMMEHGPGDAGGWGRGRMDHGPRDRGAKDHGPMDHGPMDHGPGGPDGMAPGGMGPGEMGPGGSGATPPQT